MVYEGVFSYNWYTLYVLMPRFKPFEEFGYILMGSIGAITNPYR